MTELLSSIKTLILITDEDGKTKLGTIPKGEIWFLQDGKVTLKCINIGDPNDANIQIMGSIKVNR